MTTLLMLVAGLQDPESVKVTLDVKETPLAKVLDALRAQTQVPIEVDEAARNAVDFDKERVDLSIKDLALAGALQLICLPRGLEAVVVDKKKIRIRLSP